MSTGYFILRKASKSFPLSGCRNNAHSGYRTLNKAISVMKHNFSDRNGMIVEFDVKEDGRLDYSRSILKPWKEVYKIIEVNFETMIMKECKIE